jgi:arylsulfatase A-like enzyme
MYRDIGVDEAFVGDWSKEPNDFPYALKLHADRRTSVGPTETRLARTGFYAQCTYIDHQLRLLIGALREEGVLDNTVVMFISDHGDMLGTHNLWAKPTMYEWAARVPMILMPSAGCDRVAHHHCDDRLAALRDVMPTLLDLCDIPIPEVVEGHSLLSDQRRSHIYCEHWEDDRAMRMIRTERFKLIWYPVGNRLQLFDLEKDPNEMHNLGAEPRYADERDRLVSLLVENLYGDDLKWVRDGKLVGEPDKQFSPLPNRGLAGQRGWR